MPARAARTTVFGVRLSGLSRAEVVERLLEPAPAGEGVRLVATLNLDHVVRLGRDAAFRDAYARAALATADGAPVFAYARWRGLPVTERAPGSDLLAELVERWRPGAHRPFFVVSRPATGEKLLSLLRARGFAAGEAGWACPPFGFEHDAAASEALAAAVRAHRPTHLIMGVGAPKSEVWVDARRGELGDLWACGFGSAADFLVGEARRAPPLARRLGAEWLWRVATDPRRLFRRYFIDSWAVLPAVARDLRGSPPAGA